MISFQKLDPEKRAQYDAFLHTGGRKCEYSFVNLSIWGRQQGAFLDGFLVLFSQFDRKAVYPFPLGKGNIKLALDAVIADARERGIPCCITGLDAEKQQLLQDLYPGKFRIYPDRDTFDYVYNIRDLATLQGRKYQKKRNHFNKFVAANPRWSAEPMTAQNLPEAVAMAQAWYAMRQQQDPDADFHLEKIALERAFAGFETLQLEGLLLRIDGAVTAFTMGSRLSEDTFDVHFEKALDIVDGSYAAINRSFAAYLMEKYPQVQYLNREDDMGLPGLRKAKLSYEPAFLVEKAWARLWEETDERQKSQ